jgi:hypothetical protein
MSDDSKKRPSPPRTSTVTASFGIGIESRSFDDFVKRQQTTTSDEPPVDWTKERDEWLTFLGILYSRIESFLKTYLSSDQIRCEYNDVELNEENIGSYMARRMVLKIGRQEVTFTPIGTSLIGMKGRVDVLGPAGSARIVLVNKKATGARSLIRVTVSSSSRTPNVVPSGAAEPIEWDWKIASPPPEMRFIDLTKEAFFEMVLEVSNG